MDIFPLGTVATDSDNGTINGISTYSMFEPNDGCKSTIIHNILVEKFEQQTMHTRKKSEPILTFMYKYDNIFDREFRQIERFLNDKDESLTSFYLVDFSKGQTPSSISLSSGDWIISVDDTSLYSAITNKKAYHAFIWDGSSFKEGTIDSISPNTSITVDIDTNNYGNLSLANAQSKGIIYPLYQVYASTGALSNFEQTIYIDENINTSADGGWMRSGSLSFISKYKA